MHVIDGRLRFDESNSRTHGVLLEKLPRVALDVTLQRRDTLLGSELHMVDALAHVSLRG